MATTTQRIYQDWGEASVVYDAIRSFIQGKDLALSNEAQTRFDVIDRMIKEFLSWPYGQIAVENFISEPRKGYIDYVLKSGDYCIIIEAKKAGATFPSPTRQKRLKLSGGILNNGAIAEAIQQVKEYSSGKNADVLVVTNGLCWCFFSSKGLTADSSAYLLFPFETPKDAEDLYNHFSVVQVEKGSLVAITNVLPRSENRLLSIVSDSDARVDRNNIADYILPALNNALYADALLENPEALKNCFVTTEARTRFDSHLGMYITDIKSPLVIPAKRIKTGKKPGHLEKIISDSVPSYAPPVTLIIGPVGAGKTTYLKHFEIVSGKDVITKTKTHWIYIDFEQMGKLGNPRKFIYKNLLDYIGTNHPGNETDYENVVADAYVEDVEKLSRGPFALIRENKTLLNEKISEYIAKDYEAVEPYVDKILKYISQKSLCVIIFDNVDLYEDDTLETNVFSEGLALSKRLKCHVIVSIRDTTFVKHRTDSIFDAFEFRKLWLDPPPFKTVLSIRLTYAKIILRGKRARIYLANSMHLDVPDLSKFFDIVQRSILQGHTGDCIAAFADTNIRKGLEIVNNFLTSGHIQADRAITSYLKGNTAWNFPSHEIFKGTMLGQWKYYKEERAECINIFDARLGSKRLRLLRLLLIRFLLYRARTLDKVETSIKECVTFLSQAGISEEQILTCLRQLEAYRIVRNITAEELREHSVLVLTPCGGYYAQFLCSTFPYVEACLLDTAIDDTSAWDELMDLTKKIEQTHAIADRMALRMTRIQLFMDYLQNLENLTLEGYPKDSELRSIKYMKEQVEKEVALALEKTRRHYPQE